MTNTTVQRKGSQIKQKEQPSNEVPQDDAKSTEAKEKNGKRLRFGPMITFPHQRVWTRGVLILGVLLVVWYTDKGHKELRFASQKDVHKNRAQPLQCDRYYLEEIRKYPRCVPKECGRYVMDTLITAKEAEILLGVAKRGMALGGGDGGASIFDLHSGALSYGTKFVNIYSTKKATDIISTTDLTIYKIVRSKIQRAIAGNFRINADSLYLTYPTFFSRLTNTDPKIDNDEYWHSHVDKETYDSFHYTSLLYLNDYNVDFKGGKFVFETDSKLQPKNVTVEPRKGRVLMFSSGAENPHYVQRVASGERYAVTISFTCNKEKAINDPVLK